MPGGTGWQTLGKGLASGMDKRIVSGSVRFSLLAVAFELSLGGLGVLLGWLTGPWPWHTLVTQDRTRFLAASLAGGGTALMLFAGVVLLDRKPIGILERLQYTVRRYVVPMFRGVNPWLLFLISLAAGVGEEFLFRGYCQEAVTSWLGRPWGVWWGLIISSFLFGICHWISSAYVVLATVMGLVLGVLFLATGNLAAPIVAHSLYDFLALLYLTRQSALATGAGTDVSDGAVSTWPGDAG